MRTYDLSVVYQATSQYAKEIVGFDPPVWLADKRNVALVNEFGDVALFEYESPGVVSGHYFFHSRANKAVKVATNFLDEVFKDCYNIRVIRGLTPLQKLGALWMNKQLGLKSYGIVHTIVGPCELVILTKDEWEGKR